MAKEKGLETSASEACTRGGAFALLLSLALASLIPLWVHRQDGIVLGRYFGLRLSLVAALDALDDDPLWQEYKQKHDTESVPVEQLAALRVNSTTLTPSDGPAPAQPKPEPTGPPAATTGPAQPSPRSTNTPSSHAVNPRPEAPTGLAFSVGFSEVQQVADYLTQLNDSDLLTRSRNASDLFNLSIYRWVLKRDNLIAQNLFKGPSRSVTATGWTDPGSPANFAGAADNKALLRLPLSAVRELAKAELPPLSNTVKLGRNDNEVELTTSSLPRSLYGASLLGQVLLFFVLVYVAAFARKATSVTQFPSQETIFGAFAGSRPTLAVFFLVLWTPLAVSVGILLLSYGATSRWGTLGLAVCSVLIGLAAFSAFATLNSKAYFRPLFKRGASAN